jgi:hypothetical protein
MTKRQIVLAYLAHYLDVFSQLISMINPAFGAYISYEPGKSWRLAAWIDRGSFNMQLAGFEIIIDRPSALVKG